jgi:hypothetical protein
VQRAVPNALIGAAAPERFDNNAFHLQLQFRCRARSPELNRAAEISLNLRSLWHESFI